MTSDALHRLTAALADRYTIDREIGEGGMATVYLARDVRHDRPVALKVLKPELGAILGVERFLAEIKVTANLQHPNLLPLFDSGEVDGLLFYVMPFVEGESLRARLDREKQLPVDEAVHIGVAIASALEYAHQHGVIHRDLKPENILMQSGQPMVADFGIALAVSNAGGHRITQTGLSLGTPQYMSPEQATGDRVIDGRSDIYSLAAMTYEMLTGDPPHTGSSAQAIIARLLTEAPRSVRAARPTVPESVQYALERALAKLPADRWTSAQEFASALQGRGPSSVPGATGVWHPATGTMSQGRRPDWRARLAMPLLAIAVVAVAAAAWAFQRPQPARPVTRYALAFPMAHAPLPEGRFAISPDGSHLLYVGPADVGSQLWIKARDRDDATPLAGTANARRFTFSTDGQWIAFIAGDMKLKKLPVLGGAAITLADTVAVTRGVAWLDDGSLVYALNGGHELRQASDVAGSTTTIWKSDSSFAWYPEALPGSRGVLFMSCSGSCISSDLWVLDLRSHAAHRLLNGINRGEYIATGHILYVRPDGAMLAVPFDPRSLAIRGEPMPIRDSIAITDGALFAVSSEGTFLARSGASIAAGISYEMVWVDRDGRSALIDSSWNFHLTAYGGGNGSWVLSPDGNRVAIGLNTDAGDQIWVKRLPRGPLSRVSFDGVRNFRPRWMRDGKSVMFISQRAGVGMPYQRPADGTGVDAPLTPRLHLPAPGVFEAGISPDGKLLVFRAGGQTNLVGARDISMLQLGVDTVPRPLVANPAYDESAIALSPDGRWLAYESTETGHSEVFIRPFPNVDGGKWQISNGGGRAPLWARSGRDLFFVNAARDMVVVPVAQGTSPDAGTPRTLFHLADEIYLDSQQYHTPFDISPDGQRFLMARRVRSAAAAAQAAPLIVVENWFEELRSRVKKQ